MAAVHCAYGTIIEGIYDGGTTSDTGGEGGALCGSIICPGGTECHIGRCVPVDPCRDVVCSAEGEVCSNGACVSGGLDADGDGYVARDDCDALIGNGGTGVSSRDRTYEALAGLIDRRLDGFGELFRLLSFEQIGARSMLSRAVAGIAQAKPLFALPGSPAAVQLGLERLILPSIGHLLAELRKH